MIELNTRKLSIVVCIVAVLYILTVTTTVSAQNQSDKTRKESLSGETSTQTQVANNGPQNGKLLKKEKSLISDKTLIKVKKAPNKKRDESQVASPSTSSGLVTGSSDLVTASGEKKYILVKKKPKHKKIKMDVYKPKMKYKKIKMKVPVKKMKKKKVKGYMVKKKHHY